MRGAVLATVAALALSGCVGGGGAGGPAGRSEPSAFTLDAGGIAPAGTPLRVDFGRHRPGVIATMTRLQGRGPVALPGPETCGAGISAARWDDGLVLVFRDDAFRGWASPDGDRAGDASCPAA